LRVREITAGEGVDLILDAVGGKGFANFLPMLGRSACWSLTENWSGRSRAT
jgi:NADPH:quinone reductase-like Zn-dependent oxidoreductase